MTDASPSTLGDLIEAHEALELLKTELTDFCAAHAERTGVVDFLDIPLGDAFNVTPDVAILYFQRKGLRPSFHYAEMIGAAHDQAFTVAKMMDVDMLAHVQASLDDALSSGINFREWAQALEPSLKAAGWWGRQPMVDPQTGATVDAQLGSAWRLETIFRTNMQNAYAAGQWAEITEQAALAPYLLYDAVDDHRTRKQHKAWGDAPTVLPIDSPWWRTHFPPLGFNCRCGVIQLSEDELQAYGVRVSPEAPNDGTYKWRNPRTGETREVEVGVDPGFDRNPGETLLPELRKLLAEKMAAKTSS
jgi:SPP1 gp7 family putative phage head morphogenesis protein